ncbi:MAG: hypothetical protein IJW18_07770 [Lachnospiraceae bacterium]|nr:hypothetical protein [Lachnospiraceae bacterium]
MANFHNVRELWSSLLENVNAYVFGEEFNEALFDEAMKGAFEIFDSVYNMEQLKMEEWGETVNVLQVLQLTCLMSEYMSDRYTADEDNEKFRASQLAVRLMLGKVTDSYQWHGDGVFPAYEFEYYYGEDDKLVYDVKTGDLSDMVEALKYV